jgi:hypothetical protein
MGYDKPIIQTTDPYKQIGTDTIISRTIYYGEVISIDDPNDGGRIQARILGLDNKISNSELTWCFPMLPKFFHIYPKVGEMVKIFLEEAKFPQRSRHWMGSIISQPQKIGYDGPYTALSTTNRSLVQPEPAPSTYPDANGVFPTKDEVAIVGRVNTDIILKNNEVHLRAGKHDNDNIFKLNAKNPATISLVFETKSGTTEYYSNGIIMANKIALISHIGIPQFKTAQLSSDDRTKIFANAHPMARADVLVEVLKIMRTTIVNHIHGYSTLPADKNATIKALEELNFDNIMNKNIVIN